MPKITVHEGPSYTDENGQPIPQDQLPQHGHPVSQENAHLRGAEPANTQDAEPVGDGSTEAPTEGAPGNDTWANAAGFDPGQHTVSEVTDYLSSADDAERQRVLNAELAGKNRTTITQGRAAAGLTEPE